MPSLVNASAWTQAVRTFARWLGGRGRLDLLMDRLPPSLGAAERARCQHLVYGAVRHRGRVEAALAGAIRRRPRTEVRAILGIAGFELIEAGAEASCRSEAAKVVHHAVEGAKRLASPAEAGMVNAVARRLAEALSAEAPPPAAATDEELARYFSHPAWLVRRWRARFGEPAARRLLEWNQAPAPVYLRLRGPAGPADEAALSASPWPGFFEVRPGRWSQVEAALAAGRAYAQDPSTRIPVALLDPRPGEAVLDACAAPGGKSLLIADAFAAGGGGLLVALDLPGPRLRRLEENLSRVSGPRVEIAAADLAEAGPALLARGLPAEYPAVLLDAPCSNTGVLRRRVDAKWRLRPGDPARHAARQLGLLAAAARLVAPGGRLVYSTCSIEADENEGVVAAFLGRAEGFRLDRSEVSLPWSAGHDGGGAFLLLRH